MNDRVIFGLLGALVVGLGAVVVWSLPKDGASSSRPDFSNLDGASNTSDGDGDEEPKPSTLERLPEATSEFAILTSKSSDEIARVATAEAVGRWLEVRHCGAACDAVKKVVADAEHFELEITTADDYILPPPDSFDIVGATLSTSERASIAGRPNVVVVRAHGPASVDQLPARASFAAAAAVAEALSGLVYDEATRRIENTAQFEQHVITVPLGQPVFSPKQIVVQLYRMEDGTARLLTLGMARFGSPDFTLQGATMSAGSQLAHVVNAVAASVTSGKSEIPVVVTLDDVVRVSGKKPEELTKTPTSSKPIALETANAERAEGDPDNEMLELLVARSNDAREASAAKKATDAGTAPKGNGHGQVTNPRTIVWDSALAGLFGETPRVVSTPFDKELETIAVRARTELPGAVRRFENGEGAFYVKAPFSIPEAARTNGTATNGVDGGAGASFEWMWVEVSSCDAKTCTGALSNSPGYATNLAAGKAVSVERAKIADWLLRLPNGTTAGGESIKALQTRAGQQP